MYRKIYIVHVPEYSMEKQKAGVNLNLGTENRGLELIKLATQNYKNEKIN